MFILSAFSPAHAMSVDHFGGEDGDVVMVIVPDDNGHVHYLTGYEAELALKQLENQEVISYANDSALTELEDDEAVDRGPFHYRYRFVKGSSGTKYLPAKRISNYLTNKSSRTQQLQTSASASTTWSIDVSLSGKFKEVFNAAVGGSWQTTASFSQVLTMNVAPKTEMWLEFKPLVRYVSGKSQKYFIPRGPVSKKPIVMESKNVYSTSPKSIRIKLGNQTVTAPDGAYVWKEKKIK